ncbi:MAG TPA: LCP family protein [Streptosporangiaceae bacterium]|nr:LCP family protein [Streptosporangiaceae bacterium]
MTSRGSKIVGWTSIALTVVLVVAVLGAYFDVRSKLDNIGHIAITDTAHRPPRYTNALNLLMLGSDSRTGGHNAKIGGKIGCDCSDTIMVAHISPGRGKVTVLSIPRDTMVPQYACTATQGSPGQPANPTDFERINETLAAGGPECVRTTVEQQTGIYISNTIQLNFTGFQQVINDVHGVTICVPVAISDPIVPGPQGHGTGLKLSRGRHHIFGKTALRLWRARYALADGSDLARISRDQYLMGQIFKGVLHSDLLSSPATLYRIFGDLTSSLSTDASATDLVKIAASLRHVSSTHVQFVTAPVAPYPSDPLAELEFLQPQANAVFAAIARDKTLPKQRKAARGKGGKGGTGSKTKGGAGGGQAGQRGNKRTVPATIKPSQVKVIVLNGTSIQGLAAKAAGELTSAGFTVVGTPADAPSANYTGSVIEYGTTADRQAALALAQWVSAKVELLASVPAGEVQLILGSDFSGLTAPNKPLGTIAGSFKASSRCRNSAFFGVNRPAPDRHLACAC